MGSRIAKRIIKASLGKFDLALLDLRKNNWLGPFLPGHLRAVLAKLKINCVIDVGANIGQYGAMLRRIGYQGRIISLEPVSDAYDKLVRKAANDESWRTVNVACGSRNEAAAINVFDMSAHSSLLPPSENMSLNIEGTYVERTENVTVKRIDSMFEEFVSGLAEPRVFLKIDTQGFDLEVVKGAGACMQRISGMQSEVSVIPLYEGMPDYIEALSAYRKLSFEPTGFFPILNSPTSHQLVEFDAVLIRQESPTKLTAEVTIDEMSR
jgi:FkbM family methyltransferase